MIDKKALLWILDLRNANVYYTNMRVFRRLESLTYVISNTTQQQKKLCNEINLHLHTCKINNWEIEKDLLDKLETIIKK